MGHTLLVFLLVVLFDWVVFMAAIRFAQTLTDIQLPPWGPMAGKVALVALAAGVASVGVGLLLGSVVGLIAGIVVFWVIMFRAFAVDALPLLGVVIVTKVASYGLLTLMMGWLYPSASVVSS